MQEKYQYYDLENTYKIIKDTNNKITLSFSDTDFGPYDDIYYNTNLYYDREMSYRGSFSFPYKSKDIDNTEIFLAIKNFVIGVGSRENLSGEKQGFIDLINLENKIKTRVFLDELGVLFNTKYDSKDAIFLSFSNNGKWESRVYSVYNMTLLNQEDIKIQGFFNILYYANNYKYYKLDFIKTNNSFGNINLEGYFEIGAEQNNYVGKAEFDNKKLILNGEKIDTSDENFQVYLMDYRDGLFLYNFTRLVNEFENEKKKNNSSMFSSFTFLGFLEFVLKIHMFVLFVIFPILSSIAYIIIYGFEDILHSIYGIGLIPNIFIILTLVMFYFIGKMFFLYSVETPSFKVFLSNNKDKLKDFSDINKANFKINYLDSYNYFQNEKENILNGGFKNLELSKSNILGIKLLNYMQIQVKNPKIKLYELQKNSLVIFLKYLSLMLAGELGIPLVCILTYNTDRFTNIFTAMMLGYFILLGKVFDFKIEAFFDIDNKK